MELISAVAAGFPHGGDAVVEAGLTDAANALGHPLELFGFPDC